MLSMEAVIREAPEISPFCYPCRLSGSRWHQPTPGSRYWISWM